MLSEAWERIGSRGRCERRAGREHAARGRRRGDELTVESLIGELGLKLLSGEQSAHGQVRWVHSTELTDPTPWLRGGELLLTTGLQLHGREGPA